ncbi:response regulator [Flaviaesturariibacter terrae]
MIRRTLHILHADDDADDRWIFEDGLKQCGDLLLTQFDDGEPLLEYIRKLGASLAGSIAVICDMQMRRLGGVDVLQQVKQIPGCEKIPVIIFSTSSFSEDIRVCMEKGALGFYSKPNTVHESMRVIGSMIESIAAKV